MKLVKKSITLPEDLFKFANAQSKQIAKKTGNPENVSGFIREVLTREKERLEKEEDKLQAA